MTELDAVLIVAVLVAVLFGLMVGLLLRQRSFSRTGDAPAGPPVLATEASHPPVAQGPLLVPLPNGRDEALVLGSDEELAVLERAGVIRATSGPSRGPLPQVIRTVIASGGAEANRRAAQGVESGRIVALSKETMAQLEKNKAARDRAGNVLGLIRGKNGRLAHVMRLDKAGAQAVVASNAATLAMTAAVSQQLEHIEQQLTEIRETLDDMLETADIERLGDAIGTSDELESIANDIRRRGYMTQADQNRLADVSLDVSQNARGVELKTAKLLSATAAETSRAERVRQLDGLLGKRLDYWLALWVQTELAYTRRDLLHLYWEQTQHPEAARSLAEQVRESISARQERMKQLGVTLDELSDPESRKRLDRLRLISRHRLIERDEKIGQILAQHGAAFAGPENDPYAVIDTSATDVLQLRPGSEEIGTEGT